MFRRYVILLFVLLLIPVRTMAESGSRYQVFTFSASLPEALKEALVSIIPDENQILSGAAIQDHGNAPDDPSPENLACYSAMMLTQDAEGLHLYTAAQPDGLPWQVKDCTAFLRRNRNACISIYLPDTTHIPLISVDYYSPDGLVSDLFSFRNNQLWCLQGHVNQGKNLSISNELGMISVTDDLGLEKFRCRSPFFLDYMQDITSFPTSRTEAQAIAWLPDHQPYSAGMLLYCAGANLRQEATTKSDSLGQYACNVPMLFTGEQKQGTNWPWYQVRIGSTSGWMSGNYVDAEPNWTCEPILLGRAANGCALFDSPEATQPFMQLEAGITFHILARCNDMYHICIPCNNLSWAVDPDGIYGYIPAQSITTGASPSALDAQTAE